MMGLCMTVELNQAPVITPNGVDFSFLFFFLKPSRSNANVALIGVCCKSASAHGQIFRLDWYLQVNSLVLGVLVLVLSVLVLGEYV